MMIPLNCLARNQQNALPMIIHFLKVIRFYIYIMNGFLSPLSFWRCNISNILCVKYLFVGFDNFGPTDFSIIPLVRKPRFFWPWTEIWLIERLSVIHILRFELLLNITSLYVPFIVYHLLFRQKSAQFLNSNVYFVKYSDMFRCIYIIFRESFLMYAELQNQYN
jgi:hypothetical protein